RSRGNWHTPKCPTRVPMRISLTEACMGAVVTKDCPPSPSLHREYRRVPHPHFHELLLHRFISYIRARLWLNISFITEYSRVFSADWFPFFLQASQKPLLRAALCLLVL